MPVIDRSVLTLERGRLQADGHHSQDSKWLCAIGHCSLTGVEQDVNYITTSLQLCQVSFGRMASAPCRGVSKSLSL